MSDKNNVGEGSEPIFAPGDSAYLNDTLTNASRSVTRVIIRSVLPYPGGVRYEAVLARRKDEDLVTIEHTALSREPCAYGLSPHNRKRWLQRCRWHKPVEDDAP